MLRLSNTLLGLQVMSLRTGSPIGTANKMIINPNNLKVEGWYVLDRFTKTPYILLASEIRDLVPQGLAVNDHDALSELDDLVRLKPIIDINYDLHGKKVFSESGKKYGKITDYAIETNGFFVKKIYATQTIVKSLSGGNLSIDRSQVVEITDTKIIIDDATEKVGSAARQPSPAN